MLRDEVDLPGTWVPGPVPESIPKAPGDGAFELVSIFPDCKPSLRRHDGRHNGFFDVPANATIRVPRGYSSVGRALDWQSRGQGFESPYLHNRVLVRTPSRGSAGARYWSDPNHRHRFLVHPAIPLDLRGTSELDVEREAKRNI